ncbi:hypothetical protein Ndes2437B_g02064 [Nannochloris sp. 'desiccata']
MHSSLDAALEGVAAAGKEARQAQRAAEHEAAEYRSQAVEWEQKFRKERELRLELKAQLRQAHSGGSAGSEGGPSLPPRGETRATPPLLRRNTVPPSLNKQFKLIADRQASFSTRLASERSDSNFSTTDLSSLSSTLAACLLLSQGQSLSRSTSMTHLAKTAANHHHQDTHDTVSVADDGRSGVGAAAAAAVSVALAQSWAAVAGGGKSQPLPSSSAIRANKARFKLVAAVPRNVTRRGPVPGQSLREGAGAGAGGGEGARGSSPTPSPGGGNGVPNDSSMALDSIDDAQELDDKQEATWRASGSHLKLHWLSAPSAVLVVYKPVPEVLNATAEAVMWLLRRGITVIVEPEAYENVRRAAREILCHVCTQTNNGNGHGPCALDIGVDRASSMGSSLFGEIEPLSPQCEANAEAEEAARGALADAAVDADDLLRRFLITWGSHSSSEKKVLPSTFCEEELNKLVPADVAHRVDLVLTLGGDGTVLWACSLFGNDSVPPIVPLAMGSLGFMTPFPLSRMESVLARVTSVAHGFPLMLRHRLQCRILRSGASTADLSTVPDAPCSEDALVLNEVVIDRGMTASLANLQCYVDNNFVTAIQGDGLIVSTPTGSTAYNLAAGGSMVHPSVPCILFTPICAHTLSSRPLVFPEHVTLRVKVPSDSRAEAYCSFDGRGRQALWPGDSVLIHVSQWPVPMVCNLDSSHDWFLSVREGLNWNRRVPQKPMSSSSGKVAG